MAKRNHNPYLDNKSEIQWKDQRFEYASDDLIYIGRSLIHKAATDDTTAWWVWKYSYDGSSNLVRIEGPLPGSWDNRTSLGWS